MGNFAERHGLLGAINVLAGDLRHSRSINVTVHPLPLSMQFFCLNNLHFCATPFFSWSRIGVVRLSSGLH